MSDVLVVAGLSAGYGRGLILREVDLSVSSGSVVGLVGRNGAGKTTLMRALMGLLPAAPTGSVRVDGTELAGHPPHAIWNAGMALVPQGRRIFPTLSVDENMRVTRPRPGRWTITEVYDLFPRLHERRHVHGGQLSGGEQQMLAIGRALLGNPRVLLLDEPGEGLAPAVVHEVSRVLRDLKADGQSILLVEQNLDLLAELAGDVAVVEKGQITQWISSADTASSDAGLRRALGL